MAVHKLEVKNCQPTLKKSTENNTKKSKKKDADILLLEQELKFAKVLAGNDKKLRDRVLKNLRKWLGYRSQSSFRFEEEDFMRIWKGLFYCMWMSDKLLMQEELAENISSLIHCFTNSNNAILFFNCFLKTMVREWFGIDMHRLNKFMMLVRRMLRQSLLLLVKNNWKVELVQDFVLVLTNVLLNQNTAIGLIMHFTEIYLEEIAKASKGEIEPDIVTILLKPFASYLAENNDAQVRQHIAHCVFLMLLNQSDAGIEYQEKFDAWKKQGFPGGNIECMQKVESEETDEEACLQDVYENDINWNVQDPRAGHIDVILPQILFDASAICEMLDSLIFSVKTNVKSRKLLRHLMQKYKKFSEGEFPLGLKSLPQFDKKKINVKKAALELEKFEQDLYADSVKNLKEKKFVEAYDSELPKRSKKEIRKKRKITESVSNGEYKKIKRKTNTWMIENLNNPVDASDNSIAPSNNGSVLDTLTESICKISPSNSDNRGKKFDLKRMLNHQKEEQELGKLNNSSFNVPLKEGEFEIFMPSRKFLIKKANSALKNESPNNSNVEINCTNIKKNKKNGKLFINPFAVSSPVNKTPKLTIQSSTPEVKKNTSICITPKNTSLNKSTSSEKRVKIALKHNCSQNTDEYVQQLRSSPQIPYDAERKPLKTSLKPCVAPSRINPYYKFHEERTNKKI